MVYILAEEIRVAEARAAAVGRQPDPKGAGGSEECRPQGALVKFIYAR